MKLLSWNIAGLRAQIKKDSFHEFIAGEEPDIICLQETKAEEAQVQLPEYILKKYPHRFWNSSKGTTQRKGFSGTTTWCTSPPIQAFAAEFDEEGRIIALEFEKFILVNVYVPNSQKLECDRYHFREAWNTKFKEFIGELQKKKEVIICGDMNVAHHDIDICNPKTKKNSVPGFFDNERLDFAYLIEMNELIDVYRMLNPSKQMSTYWSNFLKAPRSKVNGWRIDYFLVSKKIMESDAVAGCRIQMDTVGSDHCPVVLDLK